MFSCYIYYGPETGERSRYLDKLQTILKKQHGDGLEVKRYFLIEDKLNDIISNLENGMLFSSHTLSIINNTEILKKKDVQAFVGIIRTIADRGTIVFVSDYDKLDPALLALVDKKAQHCFRELNDQQKAIWINGYLEELDIGIQTEALELLVSTIAGDSHEMKRELDSIIYLMKGQNTTGSIENKGSNVKNDMENSRDNIVDRKKKVLTIDNLDQHLFHSREESAFTLFASYADGEFTKALEVLDKLRHLKSNQETSILIRTAYLIRQLASLSLIAERRRLDKADFTDARIFGEETIALYRNALKRLDQITIRRHLMLCSEFEMALRQHNAALHHHIIQLWLYALFSPSWKPYLQDRRPFSVNHRRFD